LPTKKGRGCYQGSINQGDLLMLGGSEKRVGRKMNLKRKRAQC
jgi:hypothetical protein